MHFAVCGVTGSPLRAKSKVIGVPARLVGGNLNAATGELDVTARWRIAGKDGVCMPSKGRVTERAYTAAVREAIARGVAALGLDEGEALACLGQSTLDIPWNEIGSWRNVPSRVWQYTLGGFRVMKKWLSYREKSLLGRGLKLEEVSEVKYSPAASPRFSCCNRNSMRTIKR